MRPTTSTSHSEEGFAFFVTSLDLGLGQFSDERLMEELRLLNQDATVFIMSRTAQVLHFCGEMNQVRQLEVAEHLFNRRGVRRVRAAFARDQTCFVSYEGATRLALLSILHSPRGPRVPDGATAGRMGALIPVVHNRMFTHPTLEDSGNIYTNAFRREALFQLFLAGSATAAGSPLPTLGQELKLGALVARAVEARAAVDKDLSKSLGVNLYELAATAQMVAACFSAIPKEGEALPLDYKDVQLLNAKDGVPKLVQDVLVGLAIRRPENMSNALAVLRSPRTAWPTEVSWRPFYVTGEGESRAALCWDIRSLHNMLSWGFAEFARPFVQPNTFGAVDDVWNTALEQVIQSAVASNLPTFRRPKPLGEVGTLPEKGGKNKNADWIAMSGEDGLVVEFKNGVARPATFRNPSPDYFETWIQQRYIKPDGLRQVYITILRANASDEKTFAKRVGASRRVWPIVVTPTSLLQSPMMLDFIEAESAVLRAELPPLPANVQVPTLLDIGELLALSALPVGTHGDVLDEFHRLTRADARMWTFDRFLYEKYGRVPENAWFNTEGDAAHEAMMLVLEGLYARLGADTPTSSPTEAVE